MICMVANSHLMELYSESVILTDCAAISPGTYLHVTLSGNMICIIIISLLIGSIK